MKDSQTTAPVGIPSNPEELESALASLPAFNWGAFLATPVWGPVHGYWITILLYPIWVFVDSSLRAAWKTPSVLSITLAVIALVVTICFSFIIARTAGPKAYMRVADRVPIEKFNKRERIWILVSAIIAVVAIALATYYNLFIL